MNSAAHPKFPCKCLPPFHGSICGIFPDVHSHSTIRCILSRVYSKALHQGRVLIYWGTLSFGKQCLHLAADIYDQSGVCNIKRIIQIEVPPVDFNIISVPDDQLSFPLSPVRHPDLAASTSMIFSGGISDKARPIWSVYDWHVLSKALLKLMSELLLSAGCSRTQMCFPPSPVWLYANQ